MNEAVNEIGKLYIWNTTALKALYIGHTKLVGWYQKNVMATTAKSMLTNDIR